jgi:ankyrin repeat protein
MRYRSILLAALLVGCSGNPDARLLKAARDGDAVALRSALRAGAHINARDEHSNATALCLAACSGHAEAVRILARAGGDVNAAGQCGGMWEVGDLVSNDPVLLYAASRGKTESIKALIEVGADVNAVGLLGSPLELAAGSGNVTAVRMLLRAGADPRVAQARDWAVASGHAEIARALDDAVQEIRNRRP